MKVGNSGNLDEDVAFVACPDCDGTGRAPGHPLLVILRRLPGELRRKVEFLRHYLFSRESWCPDRSTWWNVRLVLRVAVASW